MSIKTEKLCIILTQVQLPQHSGSVAQRGNTVTVTVGDVNLQFFFVIIYHGTLFKTVIGM